MKNQSLAIEQLDRYIRARYPAIAILSHEESRVMASIQAVAERRRCWVVTWTCTQAFSRGGLKMPSTIGIKKVT